MNRSKIIRDRQSEVRALEREYFDLRSAYYSRDWIKLDKPVRDGWWKHLKIKDAMVDTKHGKLYQSICEAVTLKVGGSYKQDCEKRWKRLLNKHCHI